MRFAGVTLLALSTLAAGLSAQTGRLTLGKTIPGELSGEQTHAYSIKLKANQYLRAVVTQPVAAVSLQLLTPDGKKVLEVDARNFPNKPAWIVWVTKGSGEYRIGVSGTGHYEIKLTERRKAGAGDLKRVEAERLFMQGLGEAHKRANDQAIVTFSEALTLYREVKDREREGDALHAIGAAYNLVGQSEKAIGYHQQALTIQREIKDKAGEASSLNDLGDAYQYLGESEKAIGYHEQALAIFREIKDRLGETATLKNLGNAYQNLSQYDKVIDYNEQALTIAREIKDRNSEGRALGNLGSAYYTLSQYEKSIGYYEQAFAAFQAAGDLRAESRALYGLGAELRQNEPVREGNHLLRTVVGDFPSDK